MNWEEAVNKREWLAAMRQKYGAIRVVPESSFEARGCLKVGRRVLARPTSPWGGNYVVFSDDTEAQRRKEYLSSGK